MYLFDTDILIDYLRLHKPAIEYLDNLDKKDRNIALITQFELLKGCHRKLHEQRIASFLRHFKILPLTETVSKKALIVYREIRWHSHIDIPDAFIIATALSNKLTLITRNVKYYKDVPSLKFEEPY